MDEINNLKVSELQEKLRKLGYPIYYRHKKELISRLQEAKLKKKETESEYSSAESDQSETEKTLIIPGESSRKIEVFSENKTKPAENYTGKDMSESNTFIFRDIEESLEHFNGQTGKEVTTWVKEFEEISGLCKWTDIQKYLYARRLLKGAAKLAVEASTEVKSWDNLKNILLNEFTKSTTSISVHKQLENRKMLASESFLEYIYVMKKIANQGKVDEESIVAYIISGIVDDVSNKTVLYEAKTIAELKTKYEAYEKMQHERKKMGKQQQKNNEGKELVKKNDRCKLCGAFSHNSDNCPHKSRGQRCFNCNDFGHISRKCPKSRKNNQNIPEQVNSISKSDSCVEVLIKGKKYIALVDTGSDVTFIKESVASNCQHPGKQKGPSIFVNGFGQNRRRTLYSTSLEISIKDDLFKPICHVVPDTWLNQDMLIGKDLLRNVTLIIKNGEVDIRKNKIEADHYQQKNFTSEIDVMALTQEEKFPSLDEIVDVKLRSEVKKLIENYIPQKPKKSCIEMNIMLEDETPVFQKPRRLAPKEKEIVNDQVTQWLKDGIVQNSFSDFASPVVLTKKADGSPRLCIDYRKLNRKIIRDRYPLPVIEEILECLHEAKVFTKLDLKNGFFHVDIAEPSRKYTAFVTTEGHYEFLKAPFGLSNSPTVFQRFINTVFHDLIRSQVMLVYLDDCIIYAKEEKENLEKVKKVLEVAQENGLFLKWEKCKFLKRKIEFLGHVIENGTIKPSTDKIKAVIRYPQPSSVKDIQSFLGLTGFFRKFIANYAAIAKPLTDRTKKNNDFHFGQNELNAFNELKRCLSQDPVLKLFNPKLETQLHTDASKFGLGAVLLQKHYDDNGFHPVFFLSYKTSSCEQNYTSYELEILAIVKLFSTL